MKLKMHIVHDEMKYKMQYDTKDKAKAKLQYKEKQNQNTITKVPLH
jgi:hypothetical protein